MSPVGTYRGGGGLLLSLAVILLAALVTAGVLLYEPSPVEEPEDRGEREVADMTTEDFIISETDDTGTLLWRMHAERGEEISDNLLLSGVNLSLEGRNGPVEVVSPSVTFSLEERDISLFDTVTVTLPTGWVIDGGTALWDASKRVLSSDSAVRASRGGSSLDASSCVVEPERSVLRMRNVSGVWEGGRQ